MMYTTIEALDSPPPPPILEIDDIGKVMHSRECFVNA